ncbi:MAG: hypothetical protein P4L51_28475 [Puia sp.]|nr:hypothetical protein [Puia sp.]
MKKNQVVTQISAALVFLFIYAALSKLWVFGTFELQLSRSPYITRYAGTVAWALPTGEILVCLALIYPPTRLLGLSGALTLMSLFSLYIYIMLHYSYYTPCSCGGVLSLMGWTTHLYFNLFFVALCITGIVIYPRQPNREASFAGKLSLT